MSITGPIQNGGMGLASGAACWTMWLVQLQQLRLLPVSSLVMVGKGLLWSAEETKMPAWFKIFSSFDSIACRTSKDRCSSPLECWYQREKNKTANQQTLCLPFYKTYMHKSDVWNCTTNPLFRKNSSMSKQTCYSEPRPQTSLESVLGIIWVKCENTLSVSVKRK